MQPDMSHFQWLLVTLTCGVGGSLLSIGSAAGVALMGTSQGRYTFLSHLRKLAVQPGHLVMGKGFQPWRSPAHKVTYRILSIILCAGGTVRCAF